MLWNTSKGIFTAYFDGSNVSSLFWKKNVKNYEYVVVFVHIQLFLTYLVVSTHVQSHIDFLLSRSIHLFINLELIISYWRPFLQHSPWCLWYNAILISTTHLFPSIYVWSCIYRSLPLSLSCNFSSSLSLLFLYLTIPFSRCTQPLSHIKTRNEFDVLLRTGVLKTIAS